MPSNYDFFMKDEVNRYLGQWVAIAEQRIVAHGSSVKKVYEEARQKCGSQSLFIAKVPDKKTTLY